MYAYEKNMNRKMQVKYYWTRTNRPPYKDSPQKSKRNEAEVY